jgi:hydroxyacylglutathione hydrolase
LKIYAADTRVQGMNEQVKDGVSFKFGNLTITPIMTPCHTTGSVCYLVTDPEAEQAVLFTGDTLFVAGCGRFFEGTASDMFSSLQKLGKLSPETYLFCGHEYTVSNLSFAKSIDPDNDDITRKLEWAKKQQYTMPSTIGEELKINPFMRVNNASFQKMLNEYDPVILMTKLRELKNNF